MTPLEEFLLGPSIGAPGENSSYSNCDSKIKEAVQHIFENWELHEIVEAGYVRTLKAEILKTDDLNFLRTAFLNHPEHADQLATAADILHQHGLLTAGNKEALTQHLSSTLGS